MGTKSLRVTVPEGVVAYLDLQPGDLLSWRMEIENGEKVVKVRKGIGLTNDAVKVASKYAKVRRSPEK